MSTLSVFQDFLKNKEAPEMYITGIAGTGKTTCLRELAEYCIKENIPSVGVAYTHKACKVLESKLPRKVIITFDKYGNPEDYLWDVRTLHSYLVKRPGINTEAVNIEHVDVSGKAGKTASFGSLSILFVDEFSMVGEKDYADISAVQYDLDGNLKVKVVYIGDMNQLPPVKDAQTIFPKGKYIVELTKVYRQANDNPLISTLCTLNDFINGAEVRELEENENFLRGMDIVSLYRDCKESKILLAYTNAKVQDLNAQVQGYDFPEILDTLFSPTNRRFYLLSRINKKALNVIAINNEVITPRSDYNILDTLNTLATKIDMHFFDVEWIEEDVIPSEYKSETRAIIFGHDNYLKERFKLVTRAVKANKDIEAKGFNPKEYARLNKDCPMVKERAEAWREFLAFDKAVLCMDFTHATTVHKSQGSTYSHVFIDTNDLYKCAKTNFNMYLRLMYVAISRASDKVYTN